MKSGVFFNNIEGMGNALQRACTVGHGLFRLQVITLPLLAPARLCKSYLPLNLWQAPVARVPIVEAKMWKKAQQLLAGGYMNLCYNITVKGTENIIMPSTEMLNKHV